MRKGEQREISNHGTITKGSDDQSAPENHGHLGMRVYCYLIFQFFKARNRDFCDIKQFEMLAKQTRTRVFFNFPYRQNKSIS